MARASSLPKAAHKLVLSLLTKEKEPLSAYQILDKLRKQGVKSPPIVYRALDKLMQDGSVHRIEHLNAYIVCNNEHDHGLSIITICEQCKTPTELDDKNILRHIQKLNELGINLTRNAVLEFPVICKPCQQRTA